MPDLTSVDLSAAWAEGASAPVDIHGDVAAECPYAEPELAEAWRDGAGRMRDADGMADLADNPYED